MIVRKVILTVAVFLSLSIQAGYTKPKPILAASTASDQTKPPLEEILKWAKTTKFLSAASFTLLSFKTPKQTEALLFVYDRSSQAVVLREPSNELLSKLTGYFLTKKNLKGKLPKLIIIGYRKNGEYKVVLNYDAEDFAGKSSLYLLSDVELAEISSDLQPPD